MAIWCVGSINIDHVYRVRLLPQPGETLAAETYARGLGGKGANQSIAAAKAGARVHHIGRIGPDGVFATDQMTAAGVDLAGVVIGDDPTGHAIIMVDDAAENAIVIFSGANGQLVAQEIQDALTGATPSDTLILQNEVNASFASAQLARAAGLRVVYSAAPFDADAARQMLPMIDLLILNVGEAAALEKTLNQAISTLQVETIVTKGADGAVWYHADATLEQPAFRAEKVVDTTGAGDCFAGYLVAGLDAGLTRSDAMRRAAAAASLQVTRPGAADAMPGMAEVDATLAKI